LALWSTHREDVARLVKMPVLTRLRSLELFGAGWPSDATSLLNDADMDLLVNCPYLARLEGLDLTQHLIGPDGLRRLAYAPGLPVLRDLKLYGNRCGDEALNILAGSPLAARLREFLTSGCQEAPLTAEGARVLASTP